MEIYNNQENSKKFPHRKEETTLSTILMAILFMLLLTILLPLIKNLKLARRIWLLADHILPIKRIERRINGSSIRRKSSLMIQAILSYHSRHSGNNKKQQAPVTKWWRRRNRLEKHGRGLMKGHNLPSIVKVLTSRSRTSCWLQTGLVFQILCRRKDTNRIHAIHSWKENDINSFLPLQDFPILYNFYETKILRKQSGSVHFGGSFGYFF